MKRSKKAILAAGLIAGAAAMTGCTANTTTVATPSPQPAQQDTAEPATAEPAAQEPAATAEADEETPGPIGLLVDGKEVTAGAAKEQDMLLLPLVETAEALGWAADSQQLEEETQVQRTVSLEKDESRITVVWVVSDNTTRQITWQKDGLLIPVDTKITTIGEVVYVPSAFFEEAMEVTVGETEKGVTVTPPEPKETPETEEQNE